MNEISQQICTQWYTHLEALEQDAIPDSFIRVSQPLKRGVQRMICFTFDHHLVSTGSLNRDWTAQALF